MMNEQLKATEALLDVGVSVPLRPLRFRRWKITPRVTVKRPPLGGLLRILRIWLRLNVTGEQLDSMSERQRFDFMVKWGKEVYKMVALMVCSSFVSGKLFAPILAFFLRWRCHPDTLLYVVSAFMQLQDTRSFTTIIKSAGALNVTAPKLSQRKRS
ncbi:MAG TPA: hypothetical protein DDW85_00665 [Porphyromonadaceae bacterium]|nr:hypothetical protein [Porphyromonadaceae bacterium]